MEINKGQILVSKREKTIKSIGIRIKFYKMTTKDIADSLVDMCRKGNIEEAKKALYAPNIISIEPRKGVLPKEIQRIICYSKLILIKR